ncbi:MAG: beta-lactamase family protein [Ruminococcus sp.]|nr:beta-lactamase family protein [Ruminococcus sp.]
MRKSIFVVAGIYCLTSLASLYMLSGCADSTSNSSVLSAPSVSSEVSEQQEITESAESKTESETEAETEAETESDTIDWQKIQQEMQANADSFISPTLDSFQFAVMDSGNIVISGTAGKHDREDFVPLTSETMYGVASCSKMAVTAAVMHLAEQGLVELDKPVTNYISDFKMEDERYKQITVRMLLNHSSGLYGNTVADAWKLGTFGDTTAHDKFIERLSTQKLKSNPGEYSIYCNDGFTLCEILCERVSGMSYAEYLRKEIFEPLGMEHTFTPQENFDTSQIAAIYSGDTVLPSITTDPAQGGLFSTAEDLCRLGKAFTNQGTEVLNAESIKAAANAEYLNGIWCETGYSTMNYGLGWDAVDLYPFSEMGIKAVTKNGDIIYSGSQMIVLPEYNLVAAAVGSGESNGVAKSFLIHSLLEILQEKGEIDSIPQRPEQTVTEEPVSDETKGFAGTYIRGWGTYELSFTDDTLIKTAYPSGDKTEYRHTGNGHFTDDTGTDYWFFEQNGHKYHVSRSWDNSTGLIELPNVMIQGTMVESGTVDSETAEAWSKRSGKIYLLISEPYDSLGYVYPTYGLAIPGYQAKINTDPSLAPFWRGMRLTSPNTAENAAEVPIVGSSNSVDVEISEEDGVEILHMSCGLDYCSSENLPALDTDSDTEVSGNAKWFRTEEAKEIAYEIPEGCSIAVYDSELNPTDNTHISGNNTVTTQKDGYIVFIGSGKFVKK